LKILRIQVAVPGWQCRPTPSLPNTALPVSKFLHLYVSKAAPVALLTLACDRIHFVCMAGTGHQQQSNSHRQLHTFTYSSVNQCCSTLSILPSSQPSYKQNDDNK
jgi:hypothetical protein